MHSSETSSRAFLAAESAAELPLTNVEREGDRQTDRQTDRQSDRQKKTERDSERQRQRDRQTEREREVCMVMIMMSLSGTQNNDCQTH